jgi:dienelactone hydrolase
LALVIPAVFVLAWVALWNVRATRAMVMTAIVTQDLAVHLPIGPIDLVGDEPVIEEVLLDAPDADGGVVAADVYRPAGGEDRGAVVMAVGAADRIRDHPAIVRMSKSIARAGIVVVVPEMEYPIRERDSVPGNVRELTRAFSSNVAGMVAAIEWARDQEYVDRDKVGVVGFSAGGGIALMATADERLAGDVDFVVTMGTYYDMVDLIGSITTGSVTYRGETEEWEPRLNAVRLMYGSIISFMPEREDRRILTALYVDEDPAAASEVPLLSDKGRELHQAFASGNRERLEVLWREIAPDDVATLEAISPSSYLAALDADLYILSDRTDDYIPHVESLRLRDEATDNGAEVHYVEFRAFNHVEPEVDDPLGLLGDTTKLIHMTWRLLERLL